ncbi:biogenesis of lysosome-related organelles complex 1 subunit 6 isoform X2 [Podarcis raffonei]|uniref:biogenesis of lysosome-related organelles complex 1 subunit 6 isoform X2 n=1 Tax=Podarcis raffonei TaxID=65483 RepID=UPI0023299229|nr:biogenesis of lysosome-related organelles complex 1 subunit 6 isoform X2 [Podarcis raffonei]
MINCWTCLFYTLKLQNAPLFLPTSRLAAFLTGRPTSTSGFGGAWRCLAFPSKISILSVCFAREEAMSLADPLDVKAASQGRNDPALDSNDNSPDEGLIEDFTVIDKKAVEQLTEGLISHYLPDLQRSKLSLKELTQNQEVLLETLQQEISKFKECNSVLDINVLFSEAKYYHNKLVNIRKEMLLLHEKTSKLKIDQQHSL